MRTISSVESMNRDFNRSFPSHGSIFQFIEALKLFENGKVDDLRNLVTNNDVQMSRKHKNDKDRQNKIAHYTDALSKNDLSLENFIDIMADDEFF